LPGRFEELAECRIAVTGEVVLGENKFVRQWLKTFYEARVIQRFAENMTALKVADMRYGPALSPRVIEHTATVFYTRFNAIDDFYTRFNAIDEVGTTLGRVLTLNIHGDQQRRIDNRIG
jgi:hypothetical protein